LREGGSDPILGKTKKKIRNFGFGVYWGERRAARNGNGLYFTNEAGGAKKDSGKRKKEKKGGVQG